MKTTTIFCPVCQREEEAPLPYDHKTRCDCWPQAPTVMTTRSGEAIIDSVLSGYFSKIGKKGGEQNKGNKRPDVAERNRKKARKG